jgi:hypothetical protein
MVALHFAPVAFQPPSARFIGPSQPTDGGRFRGKKPQRPIKTQKKLHRSDRENRHKLLKNNGLDNLTNPIFWLIIY